MLALAVAVAWHFSRDQLDTESAQRVLHQREFLGRAGQTVQQYQTVWRLCLRGHGV